MRNLTTNEAALGGKGPLDFGKGGMMEPNETICSECHWTNVSLLNYGNPGEPRWICHGCCKRIIEERDTIKQSAINTRNAALEDAARVCCAANPKLLADGIIFARHIRALKEE
jgi:hypothetical protein